MDETFLKLSELTKSFLHDMFVKGSMVKSIRGQILFAWNCRKIFKVFHMNMAVTYSHEYGCSLLTRSANFFRF